MIRKRFHVQWRFSYAVRSFGICYVYEVSALSPLKTVKWFLINTIVTLTIHIGNLFQSKAI
jgi:hypothetical protein